MCAHIFEGSLGDKSLSSPLKKKKKAQGTHPSVCYGSWISHIMQVEVRGQLSGVNVLLLPCGLGDMTTQGLRLGSKHLHLLNHLSVFFVLLTSFDFLKDLIVHL